MLKTFWTGELGVLEFDEAERHVIDQAAAADRAEDITRLYRAELALTAPNPRTIVALAAEAGLQEKQAVDLVARVNLGLGAARSPRHVRAAQTRWQNTAGVLADVPPTNPLFAR